MHNFIKRYANVVSGVLSGFDRLLFRGSLRSLSHVDGLFKFLNWRRVRLVEFEAFCQSVTHGVQLAAENLAKSLDCPSHYVRSGSTSKEELARARRRRQGFMVRWVSSACCGAWNPAGLMNCIATPKRNIWNCNRPSASACTTTFTSSIRNSAGCTSE